MIHQYKLNGYNIVLDVFSGSVHVTDDAAYDAIRYIDEGKSREEAAALLREQYAVKGITDGDIAYLLGYRRAQSRRQALHRGRLQRQQIRYEAEKYSHQGALPSCGAHL